jgi:acyl-CoA thioesterase I
MTRFMPTRRGSSAIAAAFGLAIASIGAASAQGLSDPVCLQSRMSAFSARPAVDVRTSTIVAIGSSSTEGISRNAKDKLYPATLESELRRRWPDATLRVLNKGRGGEVMADTLRRFQDDVVALKPALVIWQLGVNDVLRFQGTDGRRDEIKAGLKLLTDNGIPVILLDLQYAPIVIRDPDAGPMQDLIDVAARDGVRGRVFHFKRFAVMKELAETRDVPMRDMTDPDGLHMTDAMHSCVGKLLAEMIAPAAPAVTASTRVP